MPKSTLLIIIALAALLIGGGAGFFGGMQYQKTKAPSFGNFGQNGGNFAGRGMMNRGQFMGRNGVGAIRGSIFSLDNNSLTIQLPDGSSKIVILGAGTKVEQTQQASLSALKKGDQVLVLGTTNSDGSVTAQNVQINPAFGLGGNRPNSIPTTQSY